MPRRHASKSHKPRPLTIQLSDYFRLDWTHLLHTTSEARLALEFGLIPAIEEAALSVDPDQSQDIQHDLGAAYRLWLKVRIWHAKWRITNPRHTWMQSTLAGGIWTITSVDTRTKRNYTKYTGNGPPRAYSHRTDQTVTPPVQQKELQCPRLQRPLAALPAGVPA